jgi:hypothetical protein
MSIRAMVDGRNRKVPHGVDGFWRRIRPGAAEAALVAGILTVIIAALVLPRAGILLHSPARPFYAFPGVAVTWWAAPGIAAAVVLALAAPRALRLRPAAFSASLAALALGVRLAVNVIRHGPDELIRPFTGVHAADEYPFAAGYVHDHPAGFVDRFADLVPALPIHPALHPPGPTLLLGLADAPWPVTVFLLLCGAATAPLVYVLGRGLAGEQAGRVAGLVWAFVPSVVLEGTTSMDALFALVAVGASIALVSGRLGAGSVLAAVGAFLSYALLTVPIWAAVVVWRRAGSRRAALVVLAAAAGIAALVVVLVAWLGYEPVAAAEASRDRFDAGIGGVRPYAFWVVGGLAAFLVAAGIPVALALARALAARDATALGLAGVLVLAAASGYSRAEVERAWMFMTPWAAVAAAPHLGRVPLQVTLVVLTVQMLTVQTVIVEVCFGTLW